LLAGLLLAIVLGLALLGATVNLPLGGWAVLGGLALVLFLGVQLLVFRALGLRSQADKSRAEQTDDDTDWRAWRG